MLEIEPGQTGQKTLNWIFFFDQVSTQLNDYYTIIERMLSLEALDFDLICNIKKKLKDMFPNFRGPMDRILKRLFGETFYKNMTLFNCLDFG